MTTIQNDLSANMAQRVEAALRDGVNQILHIGVSSPIQLIISSVVRDCIIIATLCHESRACL